MVSLLGLLSQRHLAADATQCFGAGEAVSFFEAGDLGVAVGSDHDDFVDAFVYADFEEQRHFVDDHSTGFTFGNPTHESLLLESDAWVNDTFKPAEFGAVAKHYSSKHMTVE